MPDPFISRQDLTDQLGRDVTADAGALAAVDAACDMVRTLSEQTFNQTVGATAVLDGTGTDALLLPERPISAAGTVLVDGTAVTDYGLAPGGYLVRYAGTATHESWSRYGSPSAYWPPGRQNVVVTYDHGYADADIPRDIRMVALSIASRLIVQGVALQETVGQNSIRYGVNSTDLTNGERAIIRKYRG